MTLPLVLRPPQTTRELNLVRSSWTKSMLLARPAHVRFDDDGHVQVAARMNVRAFVEGHCRQVDAVIRRASLLLAVPEATATTIAGWICVEPGAVHYLYVVGTFRGMGVARALVTASGATPGAFTQWSPACDRGLGAKLEARGWTWDPTRFG